MVYFVSGTVCSGKTTRLLSIYNRLSCGDGFYNIRHHTNNQYVGQDLIHISTGESIPFSRIRECIPYGWDETVCFDNYSFSKKGLVFAGGIVDGILRSHKVAFIDELGPLELKGQGLYSCFKKLYRANLDIYAVCRSSCVKPISELFEIKNFTIL
ncbi:MAG: nucleoside-triphosphatase [Ruminiclostridium sp.]|nr:nucleoside-triphosphatase [Ruminiclostridium sp.]